MSRIEFSYGSPEHGWAVVTIGHEGCEAGAIQGRPVSFHWITDTGILFMLARARHVALPPAPLSRGDQVLCLSVAAGSMTT
ncbi:hypothetical protein [Nonomuraea sp. NPDC049709]|uniref:hypothetical protein n=1 Tax=Nonomuraea sp. NPDC049709 TaxID=3154736 RepID=UPI00343AB30E